MTIDASTLRLFSSIAGASDGLLIALYGGSTSGGGDPVAALRHAEANETKDIAAVAKQPDVARDIAAFRKAVGSAKGPGDLLANPQALRVLLKANGLGDQADYTALAQKALLSDPADPKSLVNRLSDKRWKTVASTFAFATTGMNTLRNPKVLDTIASGFAQSQWDTSLDQTTPGLSIALDFKSRAGTITSVDQILGDKNLRKAVTTALGIPEQIAFQPLEAQERAITSRLDITQFKSPAFIERLTERYLIAAGENAGQATTDAGGSPLLSLFA